MAKEREQKKGAEKKSKNNLTFLLSRSSVLLLNSPYKHQKGNINPMPFLNCCPVSFGIQSKRSNDQKSK